MNKMEVLALLFKCNAIIEKYLKNNTFDETKVTAEELRSTMVQLNIDYQAIQNEAENADLSAYKEKLDGLLISLQDAEKKSVDDVLGDAEKALGALTDLQKKLEEISKKSHLSEKAKETLSLIVKCQNQLKELGNTIILEPKIKAIFEQAAKSIGDDFNKVVQGLDGAELDEMYNKYDKLGKQIEAITGKKGNLPTKEEILSLIFECKNNATELLEGNIVKLGRKDKKYLSNLVTEAGNDYMEVGNLADNDSKLANYYLKYTSIANDLNDLRNGISNRHKVKNIIPAKNVPSATSNSSKEMVFKILKWLGLGAGATLVALAIIYLIKTTSFGKDNINSPSFTPTLDPLPTESNFGEIVDTTLSASKIDIDNYDELLNHAIAIQEKLPEDVSITLDDIIYAIRLANFDDLTEKGVFSDRDEVCAATYYIGKLAPHVGVDALVKRQPEHNIVITDAQMTDIVMTSTDLELKLEDFEEAKVEGGYDIYRAVQICLDGLYQDNDKAFYYAKAMNELVCREGVNYSVCPDSPVSTHYVIAGMYTANQNRILELTANQALGPIYGTGPRIDGGHGALCAEELASFMYIDTQSGTFIGNENNAIYDYVIEDNITCYYGQTR